MKKNLRCKRKEEGFSVAELVVSIFLVTLGMLSVAAVMTTVVNRQTLSLALTSCTNLCSSKLEEIKTMEYEDVASSTEGFGEIENFANYKREVIVTPNENDTLRVVEVVVTNATGQQVTIETVVVR